MVQGALKTIDSLRERFNDEVAVLEQFERALRAGYESEWWQHFVKLVRERRENAFQMLAMGCDTQREEDRLRGQIKELSIILVLDEKGRDLATRKKGD